jgi:prepilin-type processing-associated H-X9-DG protein
MLGPFTASKLSWALVLLFTVPFAKESTPEATIKAFVEAWNGQNYAKAATYVVGGKPNTDFSGIKQMMPDGINISISGLAITVVGDKATAKFRGSAIVPGDKPYDQSETLELVRVNDDWLIVPAGLTGSDQNMLASMAMMTTTDMSAMFARAKQAAKKTACLSNVKQIAIGALMYLADHDDKFSMSPAKLRATLNPYIKNDSLWFCPAGLKTQPAYSFNSFLLNKTDADLEKPAETVMIYEGSKRQLDFRHAGFAAVAYADGHAKMINVQTAKTLRWKP